MIILSSWCVGISMLESANCMTMFELMNACPMCMEYVYNENTDIFKNLELYNIQLTRKSLDNTINTYGHNVLDMCTNNNLSILNGRIGANRINTKLTCKDKSILDYFCRRRSYSSS